MKCYTRKLYYNVVLSRALRSHKMDCYDYYLRFFAGLNFGMNGSLLSLSTTASQRGAHNGGSDVVSSSGSSHKSGKTSGSFSSTKTLPVASHKDKKKRQSKVQRSQSTQSKLPSLKERDYVNTEIINKFVSSENLDGDNKKHVCAIRIGGGDENQISKPVATEPRPDNTSRVLINADSTKNDPPVMAAKPKKEPSKTVKTKEVKDGKMQVLVASNSNDPRNSEENPIQNQTKFKSLGDLHMEKGLPATPRYLSIKRTLTKRLSMHM